MNFKMVLFGTIATVGTLGSVTAFAATSSGSNSNTATATFSPSERHTHLEGHGHRGAFGMLPDVAALLGVDKATLRADLQAGQSLSQIAASKNISEQDLITKLEAGLETKLNEAVKAGKLTTDKEQQILSNFNAHATQLVEHKGTFHGAHQNALTDGNHA